MLSISNPIKGIELIKYYLSIAVLCYYLTGHRPEWFGSGAEALGLKGTPDHETLKNLFLGFTPDGKRKLVQNAGNIKKRQCGWDLTFSCDKTVSVEWSQLPPKERSEIENDVVESAKAVLRQIEEEAGIIRRGKGGYIHERAGLTFLLVFHRTNRENEQQLHLHSVLTNNGVGENSTGALYTEKIFEMKMEWGRRFQKELARRLEKRGLPIIWNGETCKIDGVPESLCEAQSTRRKDIKEWLKKHGVSDAVSAKTAALKTRKAKKDIPEEILFPAWRETALLHGFGPDQAMALFLGKRQMEEPSLSIDSPAPEASRGAPNPEEAEEKLSEEKHETTQDAPKRKKSDQSEKHQEALGEGKERGKEKEALGQTKKEESHTQNSNGKNKSKEDRQKTSTNTNGQSSKPPEKNESKRSFFAVHHYYVFQKAPKWNPAHRLKVPHFALPKDVPKSNLIYQKNFALFRIQVRKAKFFRDIPHWHPLYILRAPKISASISFPNKEERSTREKARQRASKFWKYDRVRFNNPDKRLGIKDGEEGVVTRVTTQAMWVTLDSKERLFVSFRSYHDITILNRWKRAEEERSQKKYAGRESHGNKKARASEKARYEERRKNDERRRREEEERRRRHHSHRPHH